MKRPASGASIKRPGTRRRCLLDSASESEAIVSSVAGFRYAD